MEVFCIIGVLLWTLKHTGGTDCPQSPNNTTDVYVCSASEKMNVSEVSLRSKFENSKQTCYCGIVIDKTTNLTMNFYGPDTHCGMQINLLNLVFACHTGTLINYFNTTSELTYKVDTYVPWCLFFKADATFGIKCYDPNETKTTTNDPATLSSSSASSTTTYVSTTTISPTYSPDTNTTTSLPPSTNTTVNYVTSQSQNTTSETNPTSNSSAHILTTSISSESQPGNQLTDIHIVIIAVSSTCVLLVAVTFFIICYHVYRTRKHNHNYERNTMVDSKNVHSKHDYANITNQQNSDLDIINPMYIHADAVETHVMKQTENCENVGYSDITEIHANRGTKTDNLETSSVSIDTSGQDTKDNGGVLETDQPEMDVDTQYAVVQKDNETDSEKLSKSKKVSFNMGTHDEKLDKATIESPGTQNLYARVNKPSKIR